MPKELIAMRAPTPSVMDETNNSSRCRLARLSRHAILQIQDGDECNIKITWQRSPNVEVRSSNVGLPTRKCYLQSKASPLASMFAQCVDESSNTKEIRTSPFALRHSAFALRHSYFLALTLS